MTCRKVLFGLMCLLFLSTIVGFEGAGTRASPEANSSEPPSIQWSKTYGEGEAYSIVQTADGGYVIAGGPGDIWLAKVDPNGDVEWKKYYPEGKGDQRLVSAQPTFDGGYIVAASTQKPTGINPVPSDYLLIKVNAYGDVEWEKTYHFDTWEYAYCVRQTADGGYIIAGTSCLFKVDSLGKLEWKVWEGYEQVEQTFDLGYVAVSAAKTIRLSPNGTVLWSRPFGGNSIKQTFEGGYIIAGSYGEYPCDLQLVKLDALGNVEWSRTYGDPTDSEGAFSVRQSYDGGYVAAGYVFLINASHRKAPSDSFDAYIVKVDAHGTMHWNMTCGGNGWDVTFNIQQTMDGGYVFAGFADECARAHAWVVKLSPPLDVAVTSISHKRLVGFGYPLPINVTLANMGNTTQTLNLTLHANTKLISTQLIVLIANESLTISFEWETKDTPKGLYTLIFQVKSLETNKTTGAIRQHILATIPGDVTGDFTVDIYDVVKICAAYDSKPPQPPYDPTLDINNDLTIDIYDVVICTSHYNQSW
jgi:hypothetical protein